MEITDTQLAALRSIFDAPGAPSTQPSVADTAPTAGAALTAPAAASNDTTVAASNVATKGDVVKQETTQGWMHSQVDRYGIVTHVDDVPAIVGTNEDGTDKLAVHADVAWFGNDGFTTVLLDELTVV